jgi:hypothetical protein
MPHATTTATGVDAQGRAFVIETKTTKRPRRTGRPMELRSKYRRELGLTMARVLPPEFTQYHLNGNREGPQWVAIQVRPEVAALARLLAQHHTAHAARSEVSLAEVMNALVEAGLPVLLRRDGWRVPGGRV